MDTPKPYSFSYAAAKKIHVYYIPATDQKTGKPLYFYAIASALLHEKMLQCLSAGDIPHFAVVVEKGEGAPAPEVKAKIKAYYGFDHDQHAA